MDSAFWQGKWRSGQIEFHQPEVNPRLIENLPHLELPPGARVLVPLAGKSLDIGWLADQGLRPIGVELSPIAVEAVFSERGVQPTWSRAGPSLHHASGGGIEMVCGDFFTVAASLTGLCDALWDRAALVALPPSMRPNYVARCADLLQPGAPGLLHTLHYDPGEIDGPPFSLPPAEVENLYPPRFALAALVREQPGQPAANLQARGLTALTESVWHLRRHAPVDSA